MTGRPPSGPGPGGRRRRTPEGPPGPTSTFARGDRGQTAVDYAIGIGLFLAVLAFAFGFVPSMFEPFSVSASEELALSDRGADRLAADLLVETPTEPATLNATCTEGFFDGRSVSGCRYGATGDDLDAALGVGGIAPPQVNATIRAGDGSGVLTLNGVKLRAGPTPGGSADTSIARRSVRIDGDQHRLIVRVW